jgi:microsomal epoxide hydrolase
MLERLLRDRHAFTVEFVRGMYRRPQGAQYLQEIVDASLLTPTSTAYTLLAGAYVLGRRDWRPALRAVNRPLLYVGSPGTSADAEEVRKSLPEAQVEILPDVGHALFVDDAVRFNEVLDGFLQRMSTDARH